MRWQFAFARTIAFIIFAIPSFVFFQSLIVLQPHSWDLDSFLYLGSRLNSGELLYTRDFETKLPLLQYIFWIPYKFGGIGAWRLMTFVNALVLAIISSRLIAESLTGHLKHRNALLKLITPLSAAVFLTFIYSLPGSSDSQIELFAASFAYFSIALSHRSITHESHRKIYTIIAGCTTAIAFSIHPNYFFTIPAFVLFYAFASGSSDNPMKYSRAINPIALFISAACLTAMVQFVPYCFDIKTLSVLIGAMRALTQFSWGSLTETFHKQFLRETFAFYLGMYLSLGIVSLTVLLRHLRSTSKGSILLSGSLLCLASVIGINYGVVQTHYWNRYSIMFTPYASVIFTYLFVLVSEGEASPIKSKFIPVRFSRTMLTALIIWYVSVTGTYVYVMGKPLVHFVNSRLFISTPELSLSINNRNLDPRLLNFLKQVVEEGMSFYVPYNTNYHRLLNHERIGDGHPVMLYHVLVGRRIGPIGSIFLYSDTVHRAPCLALWESHKDIIIVSDGDGAVNEPVLKCLTQEASGYTELSGHHGVYRIFAQHPSQNLLNLTNLL
jgi:hypothetical protein